MLVIVLGTMPASAQSLPTILGLGLSCSPSLFEVYFNWTSSDSVSLYAVHDTVQTFDSPYKASTPTVTRAGATNFLDYLTLDVLLSRPAAVGKTNYVKVFITNSTGKDSTLALSCSSPLDVREDNVGQLGVNIFPSPVSSISEILCSKDIEGNFFLYDATGRLIRNIEINSGKGSILVGGLSQGLYFYQLLDNTGQTQDMGRLSVK